MSKDKFKHHSKKEDHDTLATDASHSADSSSNHSVSSSSANVSSVEQSSEHDLGMNRSKIRIECIAETKARIKESVISETLVTQVVALLDELDKVINQMSMRLREWYEWYNPEVSRAIPDNDAFAATIISKARIQLIQEYSVVNSMGADLKESDVDAIIALAKQTHNLMTMRDSQREYLETLVVVIAPRAHALLGTTISARLIKHAGTVRQLAMTPASVIQIMGAEKALFRHMISNSKSPKYGYLFAHPLISAVPRVHKGKMARAIANKAALAFRSDYFNGELSGEKMRFDLEKKAEFLQTLKSKKIDDSGDDRSSFSRQGPWQKKSSFSRSRPSSFSSERPARSSSFSRSSSSERPARPSYSRPSYAREESPRFESRYESSGARKKFSSSSSSSYSSDRPSRPSYNREDKPRFANPSEGSDRPRRSFSSSPSSFSSERSSRSSYSSDRPSRPSYSSDRRERPSYSSDRSSRPSYSSDRPRFGDRSDSSDRPHRSFSSSPSSYSSERSSRPSYSSDRPSRPSYSLDRPQRSSFSRPSYSGDRAVRPSSSGYSKPSSFSKPAGFSREKRESSSDGKSSDSKAFKSMKGFFNKGKKSFAESKKKLRR